MEQFRLVIEGLVNRITNEFTRNKIELYVLDLCIEKITGSKFSSIRQALGCCLFLYHQNKLPTKQAAALTIDITFVFWNKANILVRKTALHNEP